VRGDFYVVGARYSDMEVSDETDRGDMDDPRAYP